MPEAPVPAPFAELVRRHRLAVGLTQEELAERAGLSVRGVSDLERGARRAPHRDTVRRLAEALGLAGEARARFEAAGNKLLERAAAEAGAASPGAASTPPLPTGMLIVLVTDVRGYTAYTHQHGDAAGAALAARFAQLAGEVVAGQAGQVVEVRGDEVLAVFTSARKALRAAVDLLARCESAATPELPLRAGVGLDVGEPVPVPGGYRGEVLNVAARLCAQAGPGEVLASEAVVGLARRVEGLAYEERGELALKGLPRPVRAWLVRSEEESPAPAAAGDASDRFVGEAGARTLPPHNLPAVLSRMIGREQEQARVRALLEGARLVTLTGTGGVGKTRLALAVAEASIGSYPDGVWLVELAPLADPALVPGAVAQALGLREEPGRPILATLTEHARSRRLLLVLDNCEHLIETCAQVAATLLRASAGVRILATSREGLEVGGEQRYRVPSLAVPDLADLPPPVQLGATPAVALFVTRAQERRADFTLSSQNAQAVAQVCVRLDGIPLAIELAAARVDSLAVEQIAARLDDRFRLLTGGPRDVLPRQQTLRAALDWSYNLLDAQAQALLRRLAVFAGGWTLEAAEAVCAGDGIEQWAVLDLLDGLVKKSLAQVDEVPDGARYRLQDTVQQYAWEKLRTAGEHGPLQARHLAWCLVLAAEVEPRLIGPEQPRALARLEAEHDNLRVALARAIAEEDCESAPQLAATLGSFWIMHGDYQQAAVSIGQSLALLKTLEPSPAHLERELALQLSLGTVLLVSRGQADPEAKAAYDRAYELGVQLGQTLQLTRVLFGLWTSYLFPGEIETALMLAQQCLSLAEQGDDTLALMQSHFAVSATIFWGGDFAATVQHAERVLALYDPGQQHTHITLYAQNPRITVMADAVFAEWILGYPDTALAWCEDALAHAGDLGHEFTLLIALHIATVLHQHRREVDRLRDVLVPYMELAGRVGNPLYLALGMVLEGWLWVMVGQGPGGLARIREGRQLLLSIRLAVTEPMVTTMLADACLHCGALAEGLEVLDGVLPLARSTRQEAYLAEQYRLKGELLLASPSADLAQAETWFQQALDLAHEQNARAFALRAAVSLGRLWRGAGKIDAAGALLAAAHGTFTEGFATPDLREAAALLRACTAPT